MSTYAHTDNTYTDIRKERKGVVLPETSAAKRRVNEKLIKIKEEMILEQHCDGTSDTELSFEYSQPIRPQQFYADLDDNLDGLNRDDYTKELLRLCHNDHSKLLDYRDRLAERAQALQNCPQTRLVNRRNSSTGTREDKCANDCYVLYAYNHGVHNKEILEIFTNANTQENETIVIKDDEEKEFIPPDLYGILVKLQSDVVDI